MAINVYWTCMDEQWLRMKPLESLYDSMRKTELFESDEIKFCPAILNHLKNVFKVSSLYSYKLNCSDDHAWSEMYDQKFFDEHVHVRNIKQKLFSFRQRLIFFTDSDTLEMSIENPTFENTDIAKKAIVIPGIFDIGKWYRNLEVAFAIRKEYDCISLEEGEPLIYLKFHTQQKINFIEYEFTEKLNYYLNSVLESRKYKKVKNLSYYYDIFNQKRLKKKILDEIKHNKL